jgi:hypothetical protein
MKILDAIEAPPGGRTNNQSPYGAARVKRQIEDGERFGPWVEVTKTEDKVSSEGEVPLLQGVN